MENRHGTLTALTRHYYIQKGYQSRMILKFCLLTLAGGFIFCALFYSMMDREIGGGYLQALEGMRFVKGSILRTFIYSGGVMILLLGAAVVVLTVLMSHRIAGPLWRVEQTAKAVGAGDLSLEVHLRKDDEIKPLADQMNRMIKDLRHRVSDINTMYKLLERDIAVLEERSAMGGLTVEESLALSRNIQETSKALLAKLADIKTR